MHTPGRPPLFRFVLAFAALTLAIGIGIEAQPGPASAEFFEAKVRPVLAASCFDCHTDQQYGGLRLDSRDGMLKGGTSGPAIVPGDPEKSLLIQAVRQTSYKLKMPKGGRLKPEEVDALVEWVRGGAQWPAYAASAASAGKPSDAAPGASAANPSAAAPGASAANPSAAAPGASAGKPEAVALKSPAYIITPAQRAFWSFQPIRKPLVPAVSHGDWAKTDIDRFVLARLEKEGLTPGGAADKRTLIRRATLDLIGLTPTPEEIDAFEKDESPEAFATVVDRLLASPRYGEAWGRMWLDVARYGEDDYRSLDPKQRGFNPYPNAYLYRDWVIKAFNDDLAYDQFVRAQLPAICWETTAGRGGCPRSASSVSARGTTTTAQSRSRAPTSGTIASTWCRAASSASPSAVPAATITNTTRFRHGITTRSRACSSTRAIASTPSRPRASSTNTRSRTRRSRRRRSSSPSS